MKTKKIKKDAGVCPNCKVYTSDRVRHMRRKWCMEQNLRHERMPNGAVIKYGGKQPGDPPADGGSS